MKLSSLCEHIGVFCPQKYSNLEVLDVTSSSEKVKEGSLFVCLRGLHFDGHEFISDALKNGAVAVIAEEGTASSDKILISKNTRRALSVSCDAISSFPSKRMKFIGVTGTNGKTSVSTMLSHILNSSGHRCSLVGTVGIFAPDGENISPAGMTTPDPEVLYPMLARLCELGSEFCVMEASSHSLFLDKLYPINFEIGIFTNLTQDHLDFHGNEENYFLAKSKLFKMSKLGIINTDDFFGERLCTGGFCPQKQCTFAGTGDFCAENIELLGSEGVKYKLCTPYGDFYLKCNSAGSFSVMNSMQASAAALCLGISKENINKAFETFSGVEGRLQKIDLPEGTDFSVFVDYAHTPDALQKVIKTLKEALNGKGRLTVLFGCGGNRDKGKRALMGKIATENADNVIITSDNSREEDREKIINDILSGTSGKNNFTVISERRDAIKFAVETARKGDFVLLAGKGHEKYEIIGKEKHYFDEIEIVKSLINKKT